MPLSRKPNGAASFTILGEEAHIVAQKPGGARGRLRPPGGAIDGYENLILLCRNDHRLIDDQPEVYPVERLVAQRLEHEQWVSETLDEAREREAVNVDTFLDRLASESAARCVERWQALGISRALALALTGEDVGAHDIDQTTRPVVVLMGDVGVGKSLTGERLHQRDIEQARADASAPIPLWIRARDLELGLSETITQASRAMGRTAPEAAVSLVVDGLDEVGPAEAANVLTAIRAAVHLRPGSRAVVTSRFLDSIGSEDERVHLAPLTEEQSETLVARVSGNQHASLWSLPKAIKEAVGRPLFAIALGRLMADQSTVSPATSAEMLDAMVRSALADESPDLMEPLINLAIASLRRGGGPVRTAEVVPAHQLQRLLVTRLVVEDRGRLRFPLIIFAQWFAAEAILIGRVRVEELLARPDDLELWRYPLAIAIVRTSERRASELLAPLAAQNAAFASIVINETVRQYGADDISEIGGWDEAGHAVLLAESSWVAGLGPLAQMVAPIDEDGHLHPLGVRTDEGWLTSAWYWGPEARNRLFRLDPPVSPFDGSAGYGPLRSAHPPGGPAWSWRWTRDELADALKRVLNERRLPLAGTPLEHEAVWAMALRTLGIGSLMRDPVDVGELLALKSTTDTLITRTGRVVEVTGLRDVLERHIDADGVLHPPWPGPDRSTNGGWVWSDFSVEQVLARTAAVYGAALAAYEHLMTNMFATLAPRMRVAATLPAVARGRVYFSGRPDFTGAPLLDWTLIPLAHGPTRVEFELGEDRSAEDFQDLLESAGRALNSLRTAQARWLGATAEGTILRIFGASPATEITYRLLWRDLEALGWTTGTLSTDHGDGRLPRL